MPRQMLEWTCGCGQTFQKNTPLGLRMAIANHTRACQKKLQKAIESGKVPFHCANGHICYRGPEIIIELTPGCDTCGIPLKRGGMELSERGNEYFAGPSLIQRNINREAEELAARKGLVGTVYKEEREVPELCTPYHSEEARFPITITGSDLRNITTCNPCTAFQFRGFCDDSCEVYREFLYKKYPVVESPPDAQGKCWIEVMNGMIPKEIVDRFVNEAIDRLRSLRNKPDEYDRKRLLWRVDEMENTRRALHLAILKAAGLTPLDCAPDTMAFKIVLENYVETRCQRLGGF